MHLNDFMIQIRSKVDRSAAQDESQFPQNLKGVIAFASTLGRSCKHCRARVRSDAAAFDGSGQEPGAAV